MNNFRKFRQQIANYYLQIKSQNVMHYSVWVIQTFKWLGPLSEPYTTKSLI